MKTKKSFDLAVGDEIYYLITKRRVIAVSEIWYHRSLKINAKTITITSPHTKSGTTCMTVFEYDIISFN